MVTFALPWALGLLASCLLIGLFYFLRMRYRRQPVSSNFLWSRLIQANEGGARLRWRSAALLVLQLLAAAALVFALAGLQLVFTVPSEAGTLYVLDTSASMGARETGQTLSRFERAAAAILEDRKTAKGPVAVSAAGTVTAVDEGALEGFLRGLKPGPKSKEAVDVWLQTHPGSWTGVLVSDGGWDQTWLADLFPGRWRSLEFAAEALNVGITGLRLEAGGTLARLTLFNGYPQPRTVGVTLEHLNFSQARTLTLQPGINTADWPLTDVGTGLWTARLGQSDALEADNAFSSVVEVPRKARVLHLGEPDPFLRTAFAGTDYVERESDLGGEPWHLVIVADSWPRGWTGNTLTFGALPPQAPVFWGERVGGPLSAASSTALSRWVPWDEVTVERGRALVVQPGAVVLAEVQGAPVAVSWEAGARFLALGFDSRTSNLALTSALPVLARNLTQAVYPQGGNPLAANLRVNVPTLRAGSPDWHLTSGADRADAVRRGPLWEITPRAAGTFTWADGGEGGTLVAQLPAAESDTAPRAVGGAVTAPPPQGTRSQVVSLTTALSLAAFCLLVGEWWLWNGRLRPRRGILAVLRVGAASGCLLALLGLSLPWPTTQRSLTLLFDASASVGPSQLEEGRRAALALVGQLAPDDQVALIAFGERPRIVSGLQHRDAARDALEAAPLTAGGAATDVGAALSAGAQLLGSKPGASQLLFSDGRANAGGDLDSLPPQARAYPVSAVPLGRPLGAAVSEGLDVPAEARPGSTVLVRWHGWTDRPAEAVLDLAVDGAVVQSRTVPLAPGENTADFLVPAGEAGAHRLDVGVRGGAAAGGLLTVTGGTRVLLVSRTAGPLLQALTRQGLPVREARPEQLPDSPEGYADVSAVVLDNVPATALNAAQQQHLKNWVSSGGGLLVVGGDSSLGRGEYYTSALEEMLPVQTDNRQRLQFTRSRLLFVVDHSGSMSEEVGGTTKLAAALGGIAQSLNDLTPQDEVGLLQFDSEATWVLPFTPLTRKKAVLDALDSFQQGGGTDLTRALSEVAEAFGHPGPVKRHVILLTDGQTGGEDEFFADFAETMKAAQVTLTVVGIGAEVNDPLLKSLASDSDGVYYRAEGADIPALLHKETVRVTRDLIQEGRFTPVPAGADPVTRLDHAPDVLGYLVTKAKTLATVPWRVARSDGTADPLYAQWRYGAGRVGVFTSDSGRWMVPWSGQAVYNRFWSQVVRSLEAAGRDRGLGVEVTASASVAHVVVEARSLGRLRTGASLEVHLLDSTFALGETAPGRYEADVPLRAAGLQSLTVTDRTGPDRTGAWVWNPPGTEGAKGGADWAGLGRLTASTGGQLVPLAAPAPPPAVWSWVVVGLHDALWLLALALFVLELGVRSTSLGQWKAASAHWSLWWADQKRPWTNQAPVAIRDEAEVERRTREAYKYLAGRKRPR